MATNGEGYVATWNRLRSQQLQDAASAARAEIASDKAQFDAERKLYQTTIKDMDRQILEYDKMISAASRRSAELRRPRTTKMSYGSSSQPLEIGQFQMAQKTNFNNQQARMAEARAPYVAPDDVVERIQEFSKLLMDDPTNTSRNERLLESARQNLGPQISALPSGQKADAIMKAESLLTGIDIRSAVQGVDDQSDADAISYLVDPSIMAAKIAEKEKELGVPELQEQQRQIEKGFQLRRPATSVQGTREVLALGEAERVARMSEPGFELTAKALRGDGVISDAERASLLEQGVDPDKYLDDELMQSIARSGVLMAERGSLAARRAAAQESMGSMVMPDMSAERVRELTAMRYGVPGTATQALLQPRKMQERAAEQRQRFTAKEAMMKAIAQAASGQVPTIEPDEEDGVYVSQLSNAIESGNPSAVKQLFSEMSDAGYSQDRTQNAFTMASRRAKEIEGRRKAQAEQAAATAGE